MLSPHILVVDDEPENLRALERTLRGHFQLTVCRSAIEALQQIETTPFAVIMADQRMPHLLGTELLAKAARLQPLATRVILTAFTETRELLDAINRAEIFRYITKPWDNGELLHALHQAAEHHRVLWQNKELVRELEAKNAALSAKEKELEKLNHHLEELVESRTRELKAANDRLAELASIDPLTKILNRRALFIRFQEEIERAKRYERPMVVTMIDVDHFKAFNDMEGHVFGDEALRKVAGLLLSNLRKTDVLARYGGEEFVALMPETKAKQGIETAERLRLTVENTQFQGNQGAAFLTISIGIADYPRHGQTPEDLIKIADQAMYAAKQHGRNRVVYAENIDAPVLLE